MSTSTSTGAIDVEARNFVDTHRPFKNGANAKSTSRRTRTLKQILAAERDAAMGLDVNAKKSKGKKMLSGAAAVAARRREEQLAAAAALASNVNSGAATPADGEGDMSAAMTDQDGDLTLASAVGTDGTQTPTVGQGDATEVNGAKRKGLPTYSSVEAPPSLRPRKKFCDITGLVAPYTDPKTGLRYHSVEIYEIIKTFGPGVDQAYLALRGDQTQIK